MGCVPPASRATIACHSGVWSLAALLDGRLAAGCDDGKVRVANVGAGAVVATLSGHTGSVTALAALPGSALASGSRDASVRVWDVGVGTCVATLAGHTGRLTCLAVLSDGRLASGAHCDAVQLWNVGPRACVGVPVPVPLGGQPPSSVVAMTALPDGRLVTALANGTIRLWDTAPAAAAGASRAVGAVPMEVVGMLGGSVGALLPLPDGRLAIGSSDGLLGEGAVLLLDLPSPAALE